MSDWLCLSMHSYQVFWQRKPFETLNILQLLMSVSVLTRDIAGVDLNITLPMAANLLAEPSVHACSLQFEITETLTRL